MPTAVTTFECFDDPEDREAFGHWDEEYVRIVERIRDQPGGYVDLDAENVRRFNRRGVPHLTVAACERLGLHLRRSPRGWSGLSVRGMGLTGERTRALFRAWEESACGREKMCKSSRGGGVRSLNLDHNFRIGWGILSPEQIKAMTARGNSADGSYDEWRFDGKEKMVAAASFLSQNARSLRELSLFEVGLDIEGVRNLSSSLSTLRGLKCLNAGGNRLGDDGVEALMRTVAKLPALERLYLSSNEIRKYSSIAPLLSDGGPLSIKVLALSYNRLNDDFLRDLGSGLRAYAPFLETLALSGTGNAFTAEGMNSFLLEVMVFASGGIADAIDANHYFKDLRVEEEFRDDASKKMMTINRLQKMSSAEKARQKIIEHYFAAAPLRRKALEMDIKIMPHMLSTVARSTPPTRITTRKTPTATDAHRFKILYNVVRHWNVPSLCCHPSPERLHIRRLEEENERLREENGALKRKAEACDALGDENKRLRQELLSLFRGGGVDGHRRGSALAHRSPTRRRTLSRGEN